VQGLGVAACVEVVVGVLVEILEGAHPRERTKVGAPRE
jgi:hypothetical protein